MENENSNKFQDFSPMKLRCKKSAFLVALFLFMAVVIGSLFLFQDKKRKPLIPRVEYGEIFSLTSDKISKSASIAINIPPNVDIGKQEAQENVTFIPEIKGVWISVDKPDQIVFHPDEKLKMDRYYTVLLKIDEGALGNDFLVVDDPKVAAVFPKENSEANEESEITVIFNRPMVPLTTLDVLADFDIPIEIFPPTEGKFKWISSKTVQFIPAERLTRSSNYYVKIKPEFTSLEGLGIDVFEHKFRTRVLRYQYLSKGVNVYNNPIRVVFNQPVDLRKTISEIKLDNITSNKQVDFIAEYGTKSFYDKETKSYERVVDEAAILIYNKRDMHGREKLWDFENSYRLKINKAYPQEGDIILNESRETVINVTRVIKNISASSERTNFADAHLFDPQGKLWIEFYEDINLQASKISAEKSVKIGYGEKCKIENKEVVFSSGVECEKETDKSKIFIIFDSNNIGNSENLKVNFAEIINTKGLKLNVNPIIENITVFPKLKILKTIPAQNSNNASLSEFVICTNTPLSVPAKEDIDQIIKTNLDFEFKHWQSSIRVRKNSVSYKCAVGEFENRIRYGLMPESEYTMEIDLTDHFDQKSLLKTEFSTGKMPSQNLNFYSLQKSYNVTTPDKTNLTYAVENMDYINLHICELQPEDMLYYLKTGISYTNSPSSVSNCRKLVDKRIELDKKYWIKNYFQINPGDYVKKSFGHYIITFSHPDYKQRWGKKERIYERTFLTVTNLSIVEKKIKVVNSHEFTEVQKQKLNNIYWVNDLKSLKSIKGAKIDVFSGKYVSGKFTMEKAGSFFTNNSGVAQSGSKDDLFGAIAFSGEDSAIVLGDKNQFQYANYARAADRVYLYTDRPIYRPSHEVYIKGLYRIGYDGDYEIFTEKKVPIKVYNSKNEEIFSQETDVNDFGTFNTKIILDTMAPLGRYRIKSLGTVTYFDVQEYVPAAFKLEAKTDKEEYMSGDTFKMDINADYYFGVPLESGEVEYSITTQNYYFDKYKDEYFNFGSRWYYCYFDCDYGDKFILRGKTQLDENGKAEISHSLDLKKLFKDQNEIKSKIFVVHATVKNSSGQSVYLQKSFIVHRGEYYLGIKTDKYFMGKNEQFNIKVKSVDTEGREVSVNKIKLKISKIEWVQNKRKEVDGGYYYRWEKKLTTKEERKIGTDYNGNWNDNFSIDEEGEFELSIEGTDKKGNVILNIYNVYVYGKAQVNVRKTNDAELELVAEKNSFKVGDKAKIVIKSPYEKAKALISIERGKVFDYKIVDIDRSLYDFSFDVKQEYIPNFYVSVVLLSPNPEIKFGKLEFQVDTEKKKLDISVKSNKQHYLPGEEVVLDFESKDYLGKAVETEFSVAVADLSVLALKGNPKKNPLIFFYGGFPLTVSTASNLKNILYEVDVAKELGSKGGGGAEAEDLAKKKRGEFKDTAFWQAVVRTDENGKAQIKFILPDNLTTWQVESVGISKDTMLGAGYQEFIARKNVMAVPLKPRFAVPGDEFYLGAKIFNQTNQNQNLDVTLSSQTLLLNNDQGRKSVSIEANSSKTLYFNVLADPQIKDGSHKFIFSAKNNKYEDTVENSIKITRNDTYEATATSGYSSKEAIREFIYLPENIVSDKGELTVKNSATLAVFLSDALNYLLSYPYGCSEQIASKLDAIAIVKKGLNLKNIGDKFELKDIEFEDRIYTVDEAVEIGLARIYETQKSGGGFAYYAQGKQNFYLTLHIANTLKDLKDAGYDINENRMKKAFGYINHHISYDQNLRRNQDLVVLATRTLLQLGEYGKVNNNLIDYVKNIRKNKAFLNEHSSNTSLATLAVMLSENENIFGEGYKNEVFNILENRIDIDSRGAFLPSTKNVIWQYYGTPIKDTALLLKAISIDERDNEILDRILRWLLRSRDKDGSWGSTNNTISVIDAMTDYLIWQRETESDFTLEVLLSDKEKVSFSYNAENILDQNETVWPVDKLGFGVLNTLVFNKTNNNDLKNNFYYDIALKYFLPIDKIPPRDEGFTITREFYNLDDEENETPVTEAKVGDVLRGHIELFVPEHRNFVSIEDFIPAGVELINFNLDTEDQSLTVGNEDKERYRWRWDYYHNRQIWPDMKELRDDRLFIFKERLSKGEYEFNYYVRVLVPGKFHHLPAVASEMYFPENFGRTSGDYFEVK